MKIRADYSYTVEHGVICVIDNDNGKSVTNDAEGVIADLAAAGVDLAHTPVIYRDTLGVWDQLLVANGQFAAFKSINERDKDDAIATILHVPRQLLAENAWTDEVRRLLGGRAFTQSECYDLADMYAAKRSPEEAAGELTDFPLPDIGSQD